MKLLKEIPKPIISHIFSVFSIGIGCLIVGIAIYVAISDKTMLLLSMALFIASMLKACNVLLIGVYRQYSTIAGTCVSIRRQAYRRKIEVVLADGECEEFTLYLPSKYKLQEGTAYIFYFKNQSIGERFDINLIGFEKEVLKHQ